VLLSIAQERAADKAWEEQWDDYYGKLNDAPKTKRYLEARKEQVAARDACDAAQVEVNVATDALDDLLLRASEEVVNQAMQEGRS
jgi:hypothetical protein